MNTILDRAESRNSRSGDGTNFPSFIFACLKQVDADPKTSAMEFRLAFVISQMINKKTRVCFPLQSTLAERLGVDPRHVRRGLANLVKRGHLSVTPRGRDQSAIYQMIVQDRTPMSDHDETRQDTDVRSKPQDRTSGAARPDISGRKTGHPCPTEPISEPISEPEERGAPARRRSSLSGEEVPTPPPTAMTESMITRALERAGWDSVQAKLEFEKFRNRHLGKGTQSCNWDAEFWLWIERGVEHQSERTKQGKVIDQDANVVRPPPNQKRPPRRKPTNTERLMGMTGGGNE
jgi:hypothetical protein